LFFIVVLGGVHCLFLALITFCFISVTLITCRHTNTHTQKGEKKE
jgi:hypothetical protein